MVPATNFLTWFLWGLFMALGWVLGTAIMEWVLDWLRSRRNRFQDFLGSRRGRH
jgi:hypothetical protein